MHIAFIILLNGRLFYYDVVFFLLTCSALTRQIRTEAAVKLDKGIQIRCVR